MGSISSVQPLVTHSGKVEFPDDLKTLLQAENSEECVKGWEAVIAFMEEQYKFIKTDHANGSPDSMPFNEPAINLERACQRILNCSKELLGDFSELLLDSNRGLKKLILLSHCEFHSNKQETVLDLKSKLKFDNSDLENIDRCLKLIQTTKKNVVQFVLSLVIGWVYIALSTSGFFTLGAAIPILAALMTVTGIMAIGLGAKLKACYVSFQALNGLSALLSGFQQQFNTILEKCLEDQRNLVQAVKEDISTLSKAKANRELQIGYLEEITTQLVTLLTAFEKLSSEIAALKIKRPNLFLSNFV